MSRDDARLTALLAASRAAHEPSDENVERVGRRLLARAAAGGAATAVVATAWKASAGASLALKVTVSGLVLGLVGGGGALLWSTLPATPGAAPVSHRPVDAGREQLARAAVASGIVPAEASMPELPRAATSTSSVDAPAARPTVSEKRAGTAGRSLNVQAEAELLGQAQRALAGGQPGGALAVLADYDRRFPGGMLRVEADATRIVALCQLGRRSEGEALARRFLLRHAGTPQAGRVSQACSAQGK